MTSESAAHAPPADPDLQRQLLAQLAAVTGGLAPDDFARAWCEWYTRLALEPRQQSALARGAFERLADSWQFGLQAATGAPLPPGGGFDAPAWAVWPWNVMARNYSNWAGWWTQALAPPATSGAPAAPALARAQFAGRLLIDAASPANFLQTNPELLARTARESGQNLVRGFNNWVEDLNQALGGRRTAGREYVVGRDVAVTPGEVVYRNRLIELIQYRPQTPDVQREPILITPAWIMKYYVLDLSPRNSLVRYLVSQGHTVFMTSWRNPTAADRELGMDDYLELGFMEALAAVNRRIPGERVHAAGYCIGGTLLSIAAARLAARGDRRLASVTLLAAQTDFSEPGELSVFISPSQLAVLEALMHKSGVLESERMSGAFALMRSRDLLWAPAVEAYVKGERPALNDLMAWNADGTRMPWRMHTEYLERLYLRNELAAGAFSVGSERVDLGAVRAPMFVVGTETDHVAPWRSVWKVRALTRSDDYTFLLTSGGHNAGIVSGPEHPRRRHRVLALHEPLGVPEADAWLAATPAVAGSWWPVWARWLAQHSGGRVAARHCGPVEGEATLGAAPGSYVLG